MKPPSSSDSSYPVCSLLEIEGSRGLLQPVVASVPSNLAVSMVTEPQSHILHALGRVSLRPGHRPFHRVVGWSTCWTCFENFRCDSQRPGSPMGRTSDRRPSQRRGHSCTRRVPRWRPPVVIPPRLPRKRWVSLVLLNEAYPPAPTPLYKPAGLCPPP